MGKLNEVQVMAHLRGGGVEVRERARLELPRATLPRFFFPFATWPNDSTTTDTFLHLGRIQQQLNTGNTNDASRRR